jgi:hypothetical protein
MLSKAVRVDRFKLGLKKQAYSIHMSRQGFNNDLLGGANSHH